MTKFRRVAVLNRGDAALRFMRGAQAWSRKRGRELESVAFYTSVDADAPFVKMASRAVALGEPFVAADETVNGSGARRLIYVDFSGCRRTSKPVAPMQSGRAGDFWQKIHFYPKRASARESRLSDRHRPRCARWPTRCRPSVWPNRSTFRFHPGLAIRLPMHNLRSNTSNALAIQPCSSRRQAVVDVELAGGT